MKGLDGSHDFFHIQRVVALARRIGSMERNVNMEVVELGALLHDVGDWKYSGSETTGPEKARLWLESQNYDSSLISKVIKIISGVGFKNELGMTRRDAEELAKSLPELAVVQDADRLDAMGAVGVSRAFTYGGTKNRPLHDPSIPFLTDLPSKEEYMKQHSQNSPTIFHFYEKLLHLKELMKTQSGKQLAEGRHKYMESFLEQFFAEWDGIR